nr:hypothetical protein CFP56_16253 [Quercus suber]
MARLHSSQFTSCHLHQKSRVIILTNVRFKHRRYHNSFPAKQLRVPDAVDLFSLVYNKTILGPPSRVPRKTLPPKSGRESLTRAPRDDRALESLRLRLRLPKRANCPFELWVLISGKVRAREQGPAELCG